MHKDNFIMKKRVIGILSGAVIVLAGGLIFYFISINHKPVPIQDETEEVLGEEVIVPDIMIPEVTIQTGQLTDSQTDADTKTEDMVSSPEEAVAPEPPVATDGIDRTADGQSTGQDHSFTQDDQGKTPEYTQEAANPSQSSTKPKNGERKNGQIYVDGFGWIEDEGGGVSVEEAPNAGTGEIIGDM